MICLDQAFLLGLEACTRLYIMICISLQTNELVIPTMHPMQSTTKRMLLYRMRFPTENTSLGLNA